MSTVAAQLRAAREAKKLTVEQVADLTKIRSDHVRALEDGHFHIFSATIYIRGSVKNYARLLKLDEAAMLAALDAELKQTEKFSELPPLVETKKSVVDRLALIVAKLNWKMGFAGICILIVIFFAGIFIFACRHSKNNSVPNLPPAVYQPANSGDTLPLRK